MSNIVHITRGDLKNSENNPNGSVTPDYVGQKCLSTKGNLYMAKGTTNNSWVPVHDETGVIKVQGVNNPGIVIQQTTNTQNTEGRIIFTNENNSQSTRIRFNHYDGVRSPFGLHIEKDTVSSDQSSHKAYLDVEGDIYSNGNKVYHAGNKPAVATTSASGFMSNTDKSKLDQIGDIVTITKSLTLSTSWIDTGIAGTNLPSGTYIIQIGPTDSSITSMWSETYSGIMSWYNGATNSTDYDEIPMHKAGHASNGRSIYLRTLRQSNSATLKLQICASFAASAATNITFKFRKMI